jgi:hypothetical protein
MPWTEQQWAVFCSLLSTWPGQFTDDQAMAYRILLDDLDPAAALFALKSMTYGGARFRPSPAEIAHGASGGETDRPSFEEALAVIRRVVPIRPDDAALERAEQAHADIAAFIRAFGLDQLRQYPIDDPEYAQLRRRDLEAAWARFCERADVRAAAGLALGARSRRAALERFDPLRALEAGGINLPQLPSGEQGAAA